LDYKITAPNFILRKIMLFLRKIIQNSKSLAPIKAASFFFAFCEEKDRAESGK
jgi:hypothetical protein